MNKEKLLACFEQIKKADNILLLTHGHPDGDAVSSICSMMAVLTRFEKKFFAFCQDDPPRQFGYLPFFEKIGSQRGLVKFGGYDLIITLDCGNIDRTNFKNEILKRGSGQYLIEIDHHPKTEDCADLEIRDPGCVSTTELLYWIYKENKIKLNKDLANCILTGIITDTGNFLYPSTTDRAVKIASEMMLYGAQYPKIHGLALRNKTLSGMKLWGTAINNLKINKKYGFAYTILSRAELKKYQADEEELDGVSGFLSNLDGVKGLLMIKENKDGSLKGSLRSNMDGIDVSKLASLLGGGGHKKAAGFKVEGRLEKVEGKWRVS